jgi:ComF family protein
LRLLFFDAAAVKLAAMLSRVIDSILTTIYPHQCFACGDLVESQSDGVACAGCWEETRIFDGSETLCDRCGAVQDRSVVESVASCPNCHEAYYDSAIAAGVYERAIAASVVNLKRSPNLSRRVEKLIDRLAEKISNSTPGVILPVPLSRSRKFERGYNQAEVIADGLSRRTDLPVLKACLVRSKQTPMHRIAMDKRARELTVEKAFEVKSRRMIEGNQIYLVDDVFTSGATASACARVLKKNGAKRVTVVTLARAVLYR